MLKFQTPIEQLSSWEKCPCAFFTDSPFYQKKIPTELKKSVLWEIFEYRHKLREFCQANKIKAPEAIFSDKFERLAAWAVSRNRFPMVIKTSQNLNNSEGIFILKAFRELPEFHEKAMTVYHGTQLIEEFVQASRYFEITIFQGKISLISQISFEKSMLMRHSWRVFPISLPVVIMNQIKNIMAKFSDLLKIKNAPLRFSFALTKPEVTLLSINSGLNRVEYNPEWSEAAGLGNIFDAEKTASTKICKMLNFYSINTAEFSGNELERLCGHSLAKHALLADHAIVMLSTESADSLLEYSKRVCAYFKHLSGPEELTNEPKNED